jgi:capsular exopolysaccharide synthesis family protein
MDHEDKKGDVTDLGESVDTGRSFSDEAFYYYKGLVGQIEIALPRHSSQALLFSSSVHGEGTTEVIVGLGLMLAAGMGRKTAIIDCNLTHPDLHRRFGTTKAGLNDYLGGELPIDKALVSTAVPNLHIMPLGERLSPISTFQGEDLTRLISVLKERFDYVLLDSSPIGASPETTVLCDKVDAVVLVVRHGATRREVVRRTREIIERAGGRMLGVVLNRRTFPIPEFLYRRL